MKKDKTDKPGHKKKSKATVMTPVAELSPNGTIEHYNAVMIEELRSSQKAVIEHVDIRTDALDRKLENFRSEVNNRFDVVEAAIRCNADNIRELQNDMKDVKASLSRTEPLVEEHDERLAVLEASRA